MEAVRPSITHRRVPRGTELSKEGEMSDAVAVIQVGSAFVWNRGVDGKQRPIGMAGRGAAFGACSHFGEPAHTTVRTSGTAQVCFFPEAAMRRAVLLQASFQQELMRRGGQELRMTAKWSGCMRVPGIVNQLAYTLLLLSDAQGFGPVELPTHTALAQLLATSRESVARALSPLRAEGRVNQTGRRKYDIHRRLLLSRIEER